MELYCEMFLVSYRHYKKLYAVATVKKNQQNNLINSFGGQFFAHLCTEDDNQTHNFNSTS